MAIHHKMAPIRTKRNLLGSFKSFQSEVKPLRNKLNPDRIKILENLRALPFLCLSVHDIALNKVVYAANFKNVFGYSDDDINSELLIDIIHPNDKTIICNLLAHFLEAITKLVNPPPLPFELVFTMDYRLRNANDDYIHVERRTTILQNDHKGAVAFCLCIYSDVSHLSRDNKITINAMGRGGELLNFNNFSQIISSYQKNEFHLSKREIEVLEFLALGLSSKSIASKLYVSKETVDTHRKKMLKKLGVKNVAQLVNCAKNNGLI